MQFDIFITLLVVAGMISLLIGSRLTPDFIMLGGLTIILLFDILPPENALSGFSNEGVITVGVLYVVVAGLRDTGVITFIVNQVLGHPRTLAEAQTRLMLPAIGLSSVLNNTPVVGMFIPAVMDWSRKNNLSPSKLLLPLSYASILGGTCTLIGTSTNLLVLGYVMDKGLSEEINLHLFSITAVGLPCAVIGCIYILTTSKWLLPDRSAAASIHTNPREYSVEMLVEPNSPLVGSTIENAGLRNLPGLFLMEIDRNGEVIPAVGPQEKLIANDRLVFVGVVDSVVDLQKIRGLTPATDQVFKLDSQRHDRILIETVVSNSCPILGRKIRDGRFRSRYNAVVIAVARNGERLNMKVGDIVLLPGDTLLLEAHPSFLDQQRHSRDFFLVSRVENSEQPRYDKQWAAIIILIAMVAVIASQQVEVLIPVLVAAGLLIATQCCSISSARANIDWQVLLTIGGAFGIAEAMDRTGAARLIAESVIGSAEYISSASGIGISEAWFSLLLVYIITSFFTELMTNNAAALLMLPIALDTSTALGVNAMPFVICIMMAASASLSTPLGYQTNLMVYGPGGYKYTDYMRFGIPLNVILCIATVSLAPLIWGF